MNNKTIKISASLNDINKRLDVFLSEKIKNLTRTYIKKIISIGGVRINSAVTKFPSKKIRLNDEICFEQIIQKETEILPKKVEFEILYHDEDVIVINKPVGLVVHPGAGNYENTLVNGLLYKFKNNLSNLSGKLRPGIIHRIDKNTSGIDIAAPKGTKVVNSNSGKVLLAEKNLFFTGGTIIIEHGHGLISIYSHLDKIFVKKGKFIKKGQLIATVGSTGRSTGPHLDFRLYCRNIPVDPDLVIKKN